MGHPSFNLRDRQRCEGHALFDLRLQGFDTAYVLAAGDADGAVRRSGLYKRWDLVSVPVQHRDLGSG